MPLTPEQIEKYRAKYNITPIAKPPKKEESPLTRVAEFQNAWKKEEPKKGFFSSVLERAKTGGPFGTNVSTEGAGSYGKSIVEGFKEGAKTGLENRAAITHAEDYGEISKPRAIAERGFNVLETGARALGGAAREALSPVTDVAENYIQEAFMPALRSITPDAVEKPIKEGIKDLAEKALKEWETLDPQTRRTLKSVGGTIMGLMDMAALIPAGMGVRQGVKQTEKLAEKTLLPAMKKADEVVEGVTKTVAPAISGAKEKVSGVVEGVKEAFTNPMAKLRGYKDAKLMNDVRSEVDEFLQRTKSLAKKTNEAKKRGVNYNDYLSQRDIYTGIKVENGKVIPDEAIKAVQNRIDQAMDITTRIIPEAERLLPNISKEQIRKKAIEGFLSEGKFTKDIEDSVIEAIDNILQKYPDEFSLSELDDLRRRARPSARDAAGRMKSKNEYAAIENATRDLLFESIDQLSLGNKGEFAALRDYIKSLIEVKGFLDGPLRAEKVLGGRLGKYNARIWGALSGLATGNPVAVIAGSEAGAFISDMLLNNQLGSSFKMKFIREITDDPEVIQAAEKLLGEISELSPAGLPAPTSPARETRFGRDVINLPEQSQSSIGINQY